MAETEHYCGNIADRMSHWADSSRNSRAGSSSSPAMQPNGTHRGVPLDRRFSSCSESGFDSGFHSDRSDESSGSQPNSADITDNTMCLANGNWRPASSEMDSIKCITKLLVCDVIDHMTSNVYSARTEHSATLLRVVDQLSSRHEIVFESVTRRLRLDQTFDASLCRRTFVGVGEELFADGQFNWGRVVTVFAFAGWLARSCCNRNASTTLKTDGNRNRTLKSNDLQKCLDAIAQSAGNYMADKLCVWIAQQGGWYAMDKFFAEPESTESKLWRGLVFTFVGLAVLAAVVAMR